MPRGPLYGRLVRGETVTAANGQVVRPEDVMEPATPGGCRACSSCRAVCASMVWLQCWEHHRHGGWVAPALQHPAHLLMSRALRSRALPPSSGPVVIVVDCPSAAFLPALTTAPLLSECATGAKRDRGKGPPAAGLAHGLGGCCVQQCLR